MWHAVYSCYETTFNVERRFGSGAAVKASMVRLIAARRLVNKQQLKGRGTDNVERRTINGHPDGIVPLTWGASPKDGGGITLHPKTNVSHSFRPTTRTYR